MIEAINKEIQESIAKNLPAAVGEELRAVLEQAKVDAQTVEAQKGMVNTLIAEKRALQEKLDEAKLQLFKHAELGKREEEVKNREHNAELVELRLQLTAANEKTQFAKDLAMGLVRNTEFKRTVFTNESNSVMAQNPGNYPTQMTLPSSSTTTTSDSAT